jgi:hypothetical protein
MSQASGPLHDQLQTFLAFDFGLKRTGVATGNRLTRTATPGRTLVAEGDAQVDEEAAVDFLQCGCIEQGLALLQLANACLF